ncbi:MAG: hypothetical protein HXS54_06145 [Theionarchaea archaeon]|nr:hypothetical protein [Theionarchaea archaeon]DBA34840.1 TPA_asm: hypothetical protein vir521_00046 [Caudoviricetes sp. vir521]
MVTLKLAWKIMSELWEWCSENPDQEKWDWPGWKKYGSMYSYCPLCEYVKTKSGITCIGRDAKLCPAQELWPFGCTGIGSPYRIWRDGNNNSKDRSKAAKKISDFAKAKLSKL